MILLELTSSQSVVGNNFFSNWPFSAYIASIQDVIGPFINILSKILCSFWTIFSFIGHMAHGSCISLSFFVLAGSRKQGYFFFWPNNFLFKKSVIPCIIVLGALFQCTLESFDLWKSNQWNQGYRGNQKNVIQGQRPDMENIHAQQRT